MRKKVMTQKEVNVKKKSGGCLTLIGIGLIFIVLAALFGKDKKPEQWIISQQTPIDNDRDGIPCETICQ